jgi:hypothetical protein
MRNFQCVISIVCLFLLICHAQVLGQTPKKARATKPPTQLDGSKAVQIKNRDDVPIRRPRPVTSTLNRSDFASIAIDGDAPGTITPAEKRKLGAVITHLKKNDTASAELAWKKLSGTMFKREGAPIRAKVVHYVLHESYMETHKDLKYHAEKVRFYNDQKEAAFTQRKLLEGHRDALKRSRKAGAVATIKPLRLAPAFKPGVAPLLSSKPADVDVDSVVDELAGIVVLCDHAEENSKQAVKGLENAVQKQQRVYLTMSNVSKMLHDTAKAMIQNVR